MECPLCRSTKINTNKFVVSHEENIENVEKQKTLKIDVVKELLSKHKNKNILIFSEYNCTLDSLENILENINYNINYNINSKRIIGMSDTISKIIKQYKSTDENQINVLLLNSKYCGSGLNLENTDIIILYHKMFYEMENQVIGRAQRLGRTLPLKVYKIYYNSE